MKLKSSFMILFLLNFFVSFGQNILDEQFNLMRKNDAVLYEQVDYYNPGNAGEDEVWDFRSANILNKDNYVMEISVDSSSRYHKLIGNETFSYVYDSGYLKQYKTENRLSKILYFDKKVSIKYPFQFCDSIKESFQGYGMYCGNHFIRLKGDVFVKADGAGQVILSEKDTLNNVIRIYTVSTTSMNMGVDFADLDTLNTKQEIEEKYEWFCKGFRYPLYVIIQKSSYNNLEFVGSSNYAYRANPESFLSINDTRNDSLRQSELLKQQLELKKKSQNVFFVIDNTDGKLNFRYSSRDVGYVSIVIAGSNGILYRKNNYKLEICDSGNIHIQTDGLLPAQYILYANVNGKVYSKIVNIN